MGISLTANDRPEPEKLLRYKEAAERLVVSERTIRNMVARGQLKAVCWGAKAGQTDNARIDPADLRAFIEEQKTTLAGENGGSHAE